MWRTCHLGANLDCQVESPFDPGSTTTDGHAISAGHFGREEPEFTWERTDKAAALKAAAK